MNEQGNVNLSETTPKSEAVPAVVEAAASAAATDATAEETSTASPAVDLIAAVRDAQVVDQMRRASAIKLIAPAKVNLFLGIGAKREDGYHEAVTVMHALGLHDVLHMGLAPASTSADAEVACAGEAGESSGAVPVSPLRVNLTCQACEGLPALEVSAEDNIACKAVRLLAARLGRTEPETVSIVIEKHIPAQAGLGGGSSDAAAALVGAARLWGLAADDERIEEVARELGADVAFFLHGGCACFTGVGDIFHHELATMNKPVILVKPEGGVSTVEAYRAFDACPQSIADEYQQTALTAARAEQVPLRNNLVCASEQLLPELAKVRAWLEAQEGIEAVLMSGSGSATFAVCDSFPTACRLVSDARARGWWSRATTFAPTRVAAVPRR